MYILVFCPVMVPRPARFFIASHSFFFCRKLSLEIEFQQRFSSILTRRGGVLPNMSGLFEVYCIASLFFFPFHGRATNLGVFISPLPVFLFILTYPAPLMKVRNVVSVAVQWRRTTRILTRVPFLGGRRWR